MGGPLTPGTAYVLFHHVMGETNGVRGVWAYVKGGMGGLTTALAQCAQSFGATITCNAPVAQILVENGRAYGVKLANGEEIKSRIVVSNADPNVTFLKLLKETELPSDSVRALKQIDYSSGSAKINVLLNELPKFKHIPADGAGPQHKGTIHISPTLDYMERAWEESEQGHPSSNPILEITIPTTVDPTIAPLVSTLWECLFNMPHTLRAMASGMSHQKTRSPTGASKPSPNTPRTFRNQ
jgi:phytoene dehydrogenase-like protein